MPSGSAGGGFVELSAEGPVSSSSSAGFTGDITLELLLRDGQVIRFRGGLPPRAYLVELTLGFSGCSAWVPNSGDFLAGSATDPGGGRTEIGARETAI